MKSLRNLAALVVTLAVGATPALAIAADHGKGNADRQKPSAQVQKPSTTGSDNAKAFGRACQGESKRHVKGEKGTPFSDCVTDMAKLAHDKAKNPAEACENESKDHVAGQKGTPFSECVEAAAKLASDHKSHK